MIAVRALYEQGKIEFLEPPPDVARALVAIVFLKMETVEDVLAPYVGLMDGMDWGEPMDEDGARAMLAVHEELAPYRTEVNQAYLDLEEEWPMECNNALSDAETFIGQPMRFLMSRVPVRKARGSRNKGLF